MTLEELRTVAVPACQQFQVKRLDVFGSWARGAGTSESDVDLLVEFDNPDLHPSKRYFGLLHYLEDSLRCDVDLLTPASLRNLYLRDRILKEKVNLYER